MDKSQTSSDIREEPLKTFRLWSFDNVLFALLVAALAVYFLRLVPGRTGDFILIALAVGATLSVIASALKSLKEKKIGIDLLAGVALIFSLLAKEWASAAFINLMLTSARILQVYTEAGSRRAIKNLLKLKPQKARLRVGDKIISAGAKEIKKGDMVVVELGERIPVDGIVEEGEAAVDQSSFTGESLPVDKKVGDRVFSSTIIASGNLAIKAEKIGKETAFEKIVELVEYAAAHKPEISTIVEKFATWYVLAMLAGSAVLYLASHNLALVLAVALVVCADDIAIAIPLAFMAAIGHAARRGVIIKGSDFLEGLNRVGVAIVDKTGTLTRGKLKVENLFVFNDLKESDVLAWAGSISLLSSHPSAKAIKEYAMERRADSKEPEKFEEQSGKGARAFLGGEMIASGKLSFLQELGIKTTEHELRDVEREKDLGLSTTLISHGGKLAGFFTLADEVRPDVKDVLSELKKLGVGRIIMLTGDNEKIAAKIAKKVGITEYHANLLPEGKLEYLKKFSDKKYKVMAIGDGVNDAALLNAADIGIAMGGIGADATIESGDIVLMQDDLSRVPETIRLARFTKRVVVQNVAIWALTNGFGLFMVFSGIIPAIILPTAAAAYNFFTDFVPITNSIRLFRLHLKKHQKQNYAKFFSK